MKYRLRFAHRAEDDYENFPLIMIILEQHFPATEDDPERTVPIYRLASTGLNIQKTEDAKHVLRDYLSTVLFNLSNDVMIMPEYKGKK